MADQPSNPLQAKYYADAAVQYQTEIQHRRQLAKGTFLVRLRCPELAGRMTPGQFVMVRSGRVSDALLGRAFALYDVVRDQSGTPESIDIVFHTVGKLTNFLAEEAVGTQLVVWGPLGNGFDSEYSQNASHLVMVAGGIGQTPFLALAKELLGLEKYGHRSVNQMPSVSLCYGARSKAYLAGVSDFEAQGVSVHIATDDGSEGYHGLVTDLLEKVLDDVASSQDVRIVCCGPEPMMEAVSQIAARRSLLCEVSLETPMACGLGICFSCVTRVKQSDGSWDFKRTCVDGPVFNSEHILW